MSFDGVFTHVMVQELRDCLLTGRITKIQQPFDQELLLTIRAFNHNYSLLLSANPNYARAQLTNNKFQSPAQASNFVMTLRKHLSGAVIKDIIQIKNDRIIVFKLQNRDELGDPQILLIYVEIMNRHSNIVIVRQKNHKIIDTIKHISSNQDRYRELLPGVDYKLPPQQSTHNPFDAFIREKFIKSHLDILLTQNSTTIQKAIQEYFMGIGKDCLQELTHRLIQANSNEKDWLSIFNNMFRELQTPKATIYTKNKQQVFTPIPFKIFEQKDYQAQKFESLSEMLDDFYQDRARKDRVRQQADNLLQVIKRNLKKDYTKIKRLQKDLQKTNSAEDFRIKGELLTTFMNQIQRGANNVTLENYYNNNQPLKISLQPQLSPSHNAQKYFKTYQKLKNSIKHLQQQVKITRQEIDYLEGILSQLDYAQVQDITEINLELRQQGYLKQNKSAKKRLPKIKHGDVFLAADGTEIHVGKNNLQNDYLTTKYADKRYTWLHIKNMPGSHVIIANLHPSSSTIEQAAQLAAYYSKAGQNKAKVPVDYTLIKYVHKPNGAKPGYVIYTNQKTAYVTPQNNLTAK